MHCLSCRSRIRETFTSLQDRPSLSTGRVLYPVRNPVQRYYDESSLHMETGFLGLQEVPEANASNFFECLDFHMVQDGLSYDRLIGWNSDGASIMLGKHNSVVS